MPVSRRGPERSPPSPFPPGHQRGEVAGVVAAGAGSELRSAAGSSEASRAPHRPRITEQARATPRGRSGSCADSCPRASQTPRPPGARGVAAEKLARPPGQNAPVSACCQPPGVVLAPATAGSCGTLTGRTRLWPPLHTRLVGWGPAGRQTLGNQRRSLLKAGGGRGAPTKAKGRACHVWPQEGPAPGTHTTHSRDCSCHARG